MNKKAFTLVELLAVIVVLAIILVIAIPNVIKVIDKAKLDAYKRNEDMLVSAAQKYLVNNTIKVPVNIGESTVINLTELKNNNYIDTIKDNTTECIGYVIITKSNLNKLDYVSNLKCGNNYQSNDYSTGLTSVEVLVIAGGGSGGSSSPGLGGGGGGGAGGLIYNSSYTVVPDSSYNIVVGNGGLGVTSCGQGNSGENSVFDTLIAIGGGGGGSGCSGTSSNGKVGGSGGGAGYTGYTYKTGALGTTGQGNKGGDVLGNNNGAGGGGAGGVGGNTTDTGGVAGGSSGNGGPGLTYSISGTSLTYAKGGKGGNSSNLSGNTNTGNGGDSPYGSATQSGSGGSGIVIIRYPGTQKANGGVVTSVNGYTIHTFTSGTSSFKTLLLQ